MAILKEIVGLKSKQDHETLVGSGEIQYGEDTIIFNENSIYVTERADGDESSENYTKQEIDVLLESIRDSIGGLTTQITGKAAKAGDVISGTFEFVNQNDIISINFGNIHIVSSNGGDYLIGDTSLDGNLKVSSQNNDSPRTLTFDYFDKIELNANRVTVPDVDIS